MPKKPKITTSLRQGGWPKRLAYLVAAGLIFFAGVSVGDGRWYFGHHGGGVNGDLPASLDYSSVNQVYRSLKDNYYQNLTTDQLMNGLKEGLAESTHDPYTEYFTVKQANQFEKQLNNTFSGVGAELGKDSDGNLVVVSPISGYPAAKAGLKAQDIITAIDGQSTSGMDIDQAVSKIRGKSGTQVTLTVVRDHSQQKTFKITRQSIQVPSVDSQILDGNIGYVQIRTFGDDTTTLMDQAAAQLKEAGVKGIVLDLRGNPGGLLSAAISVSSHWLPEGKLVLQEKRGGKVVQSYQSAGTHDLVGIPTAVLINGGSASASEITAGALHDNHAARLIGEKSYGKGVVQQIVNFNDGSELKVTVASWYRPDGQNINKKGITPDQKVQLTDDDFNKGRDPQKDAAITYLQS